MDENSEDFELQSIGSEKNAIDCQSVESNKDNENEIPTVPQNSPQVQPIYQIINVLPINRESFELQTTENNQSEFLNEPVESKNSGTRNEIPFPAQSFNNNRYNKNMLTIHDTGKAEHKNPSA